LLNFIVFLSNKCNLGDHKRLQNHTNHKLWNCSVYLAII